MTLISMNNRVLTFINVFTVDPKNQDRLCSLHRSLDGTKVTMYAQWRSEEDYQAMRDDPKPLPYLKEALTIAAFEPGMYEVVRTFEPSKE
ncbi:antibiotic biosynthesis monooxygenase [Paenibacillus sp. R14(2021)]|uniref:antibiotic biosynthesis monooxygenase n=1 Tax=Paenibacillus sp. R14(2021) TaxID=2859228 RepID=UPI001C614474|nr:antibiotic biosynthesis monooxygenase [Paenibacillus sp. R14(2021)]